MDGVIIPLAGVVPADGIAAAGVGRGCDIDALGSAILAALVLGVSIVIGDAFAAVVVIFSLNHRAVARSQTPVGCFPGRGG